MEAAFGMAPDDAVWTSAKAGVGIDDVFAAVVARLPGRAVGVRVKVLGEEGDFRARREVILCGGAFNSPQLLELSGIGRREVLAAAGVPLLHELPMVGENLSEHVYSPMMFRAKPGTPF